MWNRKKKNSIPLAALLGLSLLLSACGSASASGDSASGNAAAEEKQIAFSAEKAVPATEKEETVNVKADAEGNPKKITVSDLLKGTESGDFILDQTNLKEIRNTEGDEEFQLSDDGQLIWQSLGEDIHYEGESDASLPVGVSVSYYLNGKKVSPEEIAGASGEVRVRFDYTNRQSVEIEKDGEKKSVTMPYLFMTMVVLPEDVFTDVKVENGSLAELSGTQAVIGYAVPGFMDSLKLNDWEVTENTELPEYVEFTAHAEDFSLDFSATLVTDGLFNELEEEDLEDVDEMTDDMEDLSEASSKILDGSNELASGADLFGSYLDQYVSGVNKALSTMLTSLDTIKSQVSAAMESSGTQLTEASASLTAIAADAASISSLVTEEQTAISKLDLASSHVTEAKDALSSFKEFHTEIPAEDYAALEEALVGADSDIAAAKEGLLNTEKIESITSAVSDMQTQLENLSALTGSGSKEGGKETGSRDSASLFTEEEWQSLQSGVDSLISAGAVLNESYSSLNAGLSSLADGLEEFDREAIQELSNLAGDDLKEIVQNIREQREAEGQSISFSGAAEGTKSSLRYIIQTEDPAEEQED